MHGRLAFSPEAACVAWQECFSVCCQVRTVGCEGRAKDVVPTQTLESALSRASCPCDNLARLGRLAQIQLVTTPLCIAKVALFPYLHSFLVLLSVDTAGLTGLSACRAFSRRPVLPFGVVGVAMARVLADESDSGPHSSAGDTESVGAQTEKRRIII